MLPSATFHTAHPYINFTLKIRKFGAPARSLDLSEKGPPKGICLGIGALGPTLIQNVQYGPALRTLGGPPEVAGPVDVNIQVCCLTNGLLCKWLSVVTAITATTIATLVIRW